MLDPGHDSLVDWKEIALQALQALGAGSLLTIAVTMVSDTVRDRMAARRSNFADYSKRYSSIVSQIFRETSVEEPFDHTSAAQRALASEFFMLLSEEHYLASRGLIEPGVIEIWQDGLSTTLKHEFFVTAWVYVSTTLDFEGSFSRDWVKPHLPKELTRCGGDRGDQLGGSDHTDVPPVPERMIV